MHKKIKADLYRYGKLKGLKGFWKGMTYPGFRFFYFWRLASMSKPGSLKRKFYTLIVTHYKFKYSIQIPTTSKIGEGFYIGHFGLVVINAGTVIGKNCNVGHNVTIGQGNRGGKKGYPTLGDRVWVGTGAVIAGGVNIGNNVLIAPNSFVNFDVPDNSMVIGQHAEVKHRTEDPCDGYINNILPD